MSRLRWSPHFAVVLVLALFIVLYVWQPGGVPMLELLSDSLYLGAAAVAAVLSFVASTRFDRGSPSRRAWFLIGTGMATWTVAECLWAYYQIGVGLDVPYPSLADAVWAIGYLPLIIGLFLGHRAFGVRLSRRLRGVALVMYFVLFGALTLGLLRPMFAGLTAASSVESLVGSYYLVGNLTLAFIASLSLMLVWDGLIGRPWLSVVLGLLLFALSDSAFAYAAWKDAYAVGANWQSGVIDGSYLAAYLLLAFGAYRQATLHLSDVVEPHPAKQRSPRFAPSWLCRRWKGTRAARRATEASPRSVTPRPSGAVAHQASQAPHDRHPPDLEAGHREGRGFTELPPGTTATHLAPSGWLESVAIAWESSASLRSAPGAIGATAVDGPHLVAYLIHLPNPDSTGEPNA